MPLSTSLPAQAIRFESELWYPQANADLRQSSTLNVTLNTRSRPGQSQTGDPAVAGVGFAGGAGTVLDYFSFGGRPCARVVTTVNGFAEGFRPGYWQAGWDQSAFGSGSFLMPDAVVATIDYHVAYGQTAFAGAADVGGFWFQPKQSFPPSLLAGSPNGGTLVNGFGVAINDDGGGNNQWEFVSYDGAAYPANILQRTVIPSSVVPDVTEWTTFRFTIISAAAGRDGSVSLEVNGTAIAGVQDLPIDDVTILRPNTVAADSLNWMFGSVASALGGGNFSWRVFGRFGRFTAAGAQLQGV